MRNYITKVFIVILLCFSLMQLTAEKLMFAISIPAGSPLFNKITLFFDELERMISPDLDIELIYLPGSRTVIMLERGDIDADTARTKNTYSKASNVIMIEVATAFLNYYAFTKKDIVIKDYTSLLSYKFVIHRGFSAGEDFLIGKNFETVYRVNRVEQSFYMLDRDRADFTIYTQVGANSILQGPEFKDSEIKMLTPPLFTIPLYLFVHKKHKDLAPLIESAIKTMIETGRYEEILGFKYSAE